MQSATVTFRNSNNLTSALREHALGRDPGLLNNEEKDMNLTRDQIDRTYAGAMSALQELDGLRLAGTNPDLL